MVEPVNSIAEVCPPPRIRVISLALIRRPSTGGWLAVRGEDARKGEVFYRPAGGGVEFGESSQDAVCREMMEEFGALVQPVRLMGTSENIFTYMGNTGHEIVFLWECRFVDERFYALDEIVSADDDGNRAPAHWIDPDDLAARGIPLYPDGLPELLKKVIEA
ncbi:MAG: NUDIX domain-containing protein [Chloroflexi bacterium]|nr:MAG: NUDIX domain-containing protein [Chloroflexota bacterium]